MATTNKLKLIKAMLIDKLDVEDVSKTLGVCTYSLYKLLKGWDIPSPRNKNRVARINELKQYYYQSTS